MQSFNLNISSNNLNKTVIIPINSVYERNTFCSNTEGFIQKSYKSITPLFNSRNSEDFLKTILLLKDQKLKNKITFKQLIFENPFLNTIKTKRKKFLYNLKNKKNFSKKIFFILQNQQIILKQFFILDPISKNSKIMAECSLFLKQNNNFNL